MSSATRVCAATRRAALGGAGAALLVIATAAAAQAHVTVHSTNAKPGGTNATIVFNVPNEETAAKTTSIEIDLPTDTPLVGVTPKAPAGWSATTTADKIVFSGGTISGADSVKFPVKVAQLPKADTVVFKAIQTYSNGDVVKWIDQAAPGAAEPAHPAPTLDLLHPSRLSADESQDLKADSAKGPTTSTATAAPTAAPPAAQTSSAAKPAPAAKARPGAEPKQMLVHAGDGGQAAEAASGGGSPIVPIGLIAAGLGAAAVATRSLLRRR